jgi:hypothetical protein
MLKSAIDATTAILIYQSVAHFGARWDVGNPAP